MLVSALLTPDTGAEVSQRLFTLLIILNDRKGWEGSLGEHGPEHLAKIPQLGQMLAAVLEKYDFVHALSVVLPVMVER